MTNLPVPFDTSMEGPTLWATVDGRKALQVIDSAEPLSGQIGKTIRLQDIVMHLVDVTDPKTGELISARRIVLICADGRAYASVSKGIYNSLQRLVGAFGLPDQWPADGLAVKVSARAAKIGSVFTLTPA